MEILAFDDSKLIVPANPELPDDTSHKVDLPDGRWSLWRWAALRGTGFPVDMLLELGAAACARSADELNKKQQNETKCFKRRLLNEIALNTIVKQNTASQHSTKQNEKQNKDTTLFDSNFILFVKCSFRFYY